MMALANHGRRSFASDHSQTTANHHNRGIGRHYAGHQHEPTDDNNYPDDADDTQDGDVCLAYDDDNSEYYDDNQDWDDQYE